MCGWEVPILINAVQERDLPSGSQAQTMLNRVISREHKKTLQFLKGLL